MFKNYFKTAWRNLLKNKTFSFINIIGLAISMSACLLIILIIADQKSYDRFHSNKERIYRINTVGVRGNDMQTATAAFPLGEELIKNNTGIEAAATLVRKVGGDVFYKDKIASGGGYFADGGLFKVMDFQLEEGDAKTALNNPFSLVISKKLASQLFYNENPVGKTVKLNDKGIVPGVPETGNRETEYGEFMITGVLKPSAGKTNLPFEMLASISSIPSLNKDSILNYPTGDWNNVWESYTFVLLQKGKSKTDLQTALNGISEKKFLPNTGTDYRFEAVAVTDITPGPAIGNTTAVTIPEGVLLFLSILCLIVMLSACLNYTNLSVARSLTRAKEVGIRKVSGATRRQIFAQFITESVLMSFIALILSFFLLLILQPLFSSLWLNKLFNISFVYSWQTVLLFLTFSLLVGLIAGLLPAAYISVFNPIQIFKSMNQIKMFRRLTVRKVLLVVQFCVSLIFIISASLIYLQTKHVFNFNYGFNKENVVNIKLYKTENYNRFVQEISSNKNIKAASACSFPPASGTQNSTRSYKAENRNDSLQVNYLDVDAKCMDVWGLTLVAGKNLPDIPAAQGEQFVLINEKLVQAYKYPSAAAAVGQRLLIDGNNVEIAGVVKDFQFLNVDQSIEPLVLRNRFSTFGFVIVRIDANNPQQTVSYLESVWKKVNPSTKFEYEYFDKQLLLVHSVLSDAAAVVGFITLLAVIISCLGLLGMATYTAETKRKEVSVRKVLGSSVQSIILLLSKNFMMLLGIAVLIATPIAYIINNMWLQFFASRVSIGAGVLLAGIAMLTVLSLIIVFSQAWRVSRVNPVSTLRSE
jgi:putative ABC transport system permease protein